MAPTILAFALRPSTEWNEESPGALEAIAAHINASGTGSVTPLDASGRAISHGERWKFVAPDEASEDWKEPQAIHFLRLPTHGPIAKFRQMLRVDPRVEFVEELRPEHIVFPSAKGDIQGLEMLESTETAPPGIKTQWSIDRCQFPSVWDAFEIGDEPGPVFVIDNGKPSKKSALAADRLVFHDHEAGPSSSADHAAAVVGVLAPHRGGGVLGFGCASPRVELFNVFDSSGFLDKADVSVALVAAAKARASVVNMSFAMLDMPQSVDAAIRACTRQGVLVVASMGAASAPNARFPAKHPDVIAVGGTTVRETRDLAWPSGDYMFISAPAEFIDTVALQRMDGTSFAAPLVAGAIWLARRKRPDLSAAEIRKRLEKAVFLPPGAKKEDVGFGRLDMLAMQTALAEP